MEDMPVIHARDIEEGRRSLDQWREAALQQLGQVTGMGASDGDIPRDDVEHSPADIRLRISPRLARRTWAMAVRYSLYMLQQKAPGPGVEVRVAPWGAVKILDGPASDPHNLTPPDVIELEPSVWLRVATGITRWDEERAAGHVTAVGERDDLGGLLPLL